VNGYTVKCDAIASVSGGSADTFLTVCKGNSCSASTAFKSGDSKTLTVGTDSVKVTLVTIAYGASVGITVG